MSKPCLLASKHSIPIPGTVYIQFEDVLYVFCVDQSTVKTCKKKNVYIVQSIYIFTAVDSEQIYTFLTFQTVQDVVFLECKTISY